MIRVGRRPALAMLGAVLGLRSAFAVAQEGRSAGRVGSCCGRIDTHAHYLPPAYRAAVAAAGLQTVDGGVTLPEWSADRHLAMMDSNHIATSILSLSSPSVQFLEGEKRTILARTVNEFGADLVAKHIGRFGLFLTLPLPDIDASLAEIDYGFDTLGADGVVLMTNAGGRYPGDPAYTPIFEALDRREAVVYLHPTSPCGHDAFDMGLPTPVIEFPFDTVRAAVSIIYSGLLRRFPRIRLILSHAGGSLPMLASRIASMSGLPIINPRPEGGPAEVSEMLAAIYYDLALSANDTAVDALRHIAPDEHILFGTDFPFARGVGLDAHFSAFDALRKRLGDDVADKIVHMNALSLFPRLRAYRPSS